MKNKKQNQFSENRLVFFAEVQKLAESEVQSVQSKKEKEGPELDTKSLVDQANSEMDKYSAQLNEMPADFNKLLHDEIVKYFLSSESRYEKDENAGLSAKEFGEYRTAMIAKTKELLAEYAPTEEDIKKKKEADKQAKETQKNAENVKPLDLKAIQEEPGAIPDLQTLNTKFEEYNGWNASLQKAGVDVITLGQSVGKSYAEYKKNRDGVGAYKKFKGYLFPEDDQQRIDMQNAVDGAKQKVAEALKNFDEAKGKLKKYGEGLSKASDAQKQAQVEERTKALDEIDKHSKDSEETKKAREAQYQQLNANQKSLEGEKKTLEEHRDNLSKGQEAVATKEQDAKNKQESLTQFDTSVKAAIGRIDEALQNPDLSDEEIQQLQETKKQLEEKSAEVGSGLKATDEILAGTSAAASTLSEEEKAAADRSLNIQSHLDGQVAPTLTALDGSIKTLESAKLKFATTKDEVNEHFDKIFQTYDTVDASVDNAVLKNNLANEQINGQLSKMEKSLAGMDTKPPSGLGGAFEATIGIPLSMIGGGLSEASHFLLDQATWLSNTLASSKEDWTKSTLGTIGYWSARVGVEVVSSTIGVAGGLVELGAGIVTMVAHPVDTVKGLGTLVGLNPDVSAGTAWAEMGKSLISYEDFKAGRIGVGIGKIFVNIVTTVTGAGAVGAGGKGASAMYTAARAAGKSVPRAIAKAAVAGAKEAVVFVGQEVKTGATEALGTAAKLPGKIVEAAKNIPGALGEAGTASAQALAKMRELGISGTAAEAVRIGKTGVEFVGGSFKSVGEGMVDISKRFLTKEGRADAQLQKLAATEASLATDLSKSSEKYQEYQNAMRKLREDNPGMSEADLKLKMAEKNAGLVAEANTYEANLKKFEDAQKNFEKSISDRISDPARKEELQKIFESRRDAQKVMVESSADYQSFRKKLEKKDPEATKAAKDYQEALASGDKARIDAVKAAHPDLANVFNYFDAQVAYGKSMREIATVQMAEDVSKETAGLAGRKPEEIQQYLDGLNQKYAGRLGGEPRIVAELADGKGVIIMGEDGKLRVVSKTTAESHFLSVFSEDISDAMKKEGQVSEKTGAWIDEEGKIHYNGKYFESRYGVKMAQKEGKNIFIVGGQEMSPMEFYRTKEGRIVLKDMKMLKDHEVTHRLLGAAENISGGKLGKDIMGVFERNPGLQEAFLNRGVEMNQRNIQEFLCEVADGRVNLEPHQIVELEAAIGKNIHGFSFEEVRKLDTKRLKMTSPDEMARAFEDAFTIRDPVLDSMSHRKAYDDLTLLLQKKPELRQNPREIRRLLGDEAYDRASEYMLAQQRFEKVKVAQVTFETTRDAMVTAFDRVADADRVLVEKAKETIYAALARGELESLNLFKSKSKIYAKYQAEFGLLEDFYKSKLHLQMLDDLAKLPANTSPKLRQVLIQNSEHLTSAKLSVIQLYAHDMSDVMTILHHDNPALLNMLARDTRGVLGEYTELIIHSPSTLENIITPEKAAFLEANLGTPALSKDLVERIISGSPEKVSINGVEFQYYADKGKAVGEGGMGTFYRVALIEPGTNKLRYAGVKVAKPGLNLGSEAKGAQHVFDIVEAEAAAGNPAARETFARPIGVSADGKLIFYDIADYKGADGFRATQDYEKYMEDPAASPETLLRGLRDGAKGLEYLHANGLVHADFKAAQIFRTDAGGRLGDFGTLTTNDEFLAGVTGNPGAYDFQGQIPDPIYVGHVPAACSPNYWSGEVSDAVRARGAQYAWKVDAYALGSDIEATLTGHITVKKAVRLPDGTWKPHPTEYVAMYVNPPHPPTDPAAVAKLTEIYQKLKDPNNFTYTVADAVRDMAPYIH